jgi:hypothetical protein
VDAVAALGGYFCNELAGLADTEDEDAHGESVSLKMRCFGLSCTFRTARSRLRLSIATVGEVAEEEQRVSL